MAGGAAGMVLIVRDHADALALGHAPAVQHAVGIEPRRISYGMSGGKRTVSLWLFTSR